MDYVIVNTATKGKNKEDFFAWAIENKLYRNRESEPDLKETYASGMKAVFEQRRESKSITAVVAFDRNEPVAIILCINDFAKRNIDFRTWGRKKPFKTFPEVEALYLGNIMCYVKPEYRKNGIASEMLQILEIEKGKTLIANKEKPTTLMFFKAREKAMDLIREAGRFSYPVYDNYQHHFDNYGGMLYDKKYDDCNMNTTKCRYKIEPQIEDIENNKVKELSVKKCIEYKKKINKSSELKI